MLVGDPGPHQLCDLARRLADVDWTAVDLNPVGLDPRHVQQVIDEIDEPIGGAQNDVDELALAVGHVLRGAVEQFDEALDRGQRTAKLVRCGGHEIALGLLEPSALAHVAHRPDDAVGLTAKRRGGHRERTAAVLDDRLAAERGLDRRQWAFDSVNHLTHRQLGYELASAWVHSQNLGRIRLGHDQRVAQALDRDGQPPALLLDVVLGARQLLTHRVEGHAELLQLPRPGRRDAAPKLAGSECSGSADECVEWLAHRADQHGDQRQDSKKCQQSGGRDPDRRGTRVGVRPGPRRGLASLLASLKASREGSSAGQGSLQRRGVRQSAARRELSRLVLGGDLRAHEPRAERIVAGQRKRSCRGSRVRPLERAADRSRR